MIHDVKCCDSIIHIICGRFQRSWFHWAALICAALQVNEIDDSSRMADAIRIHKIFENCECILCLRSDTGSSGLGAYDINQSRLGIPDLAMSLWKQGNNSWRFGSVNANPGLSATKASMHPLNSRKVAEVHDQTVGHDGFHKDATRG